jgi:hypothetical protein
MAVVLWFVVSTGLSFIAWRHWQRRIEDLQRELVKERYIAAICREMLETMGVTLTIADRPDGGVKVRGVTHRVTLPRCPKCHNVVLECVFCTQARHDLERMAQ